MAIKFTTTKTGGDFVKLLVYGQSGVGKTRLAATAPKPVIISSEKKLISLKDFDIPVVLIENHMDLEAAYKAVTSEKGKGFQTVVIDSISDIAETILAYFIANPEDDNPHGQAAYGSLAKVLMPLIKKFRDISDKNIYFIAKSKMIEDQYTNVSVFSPSLPGKILPGNISYEFDYTFAMRIGENPDTGKKFRYLQTQPDIQWHAKGTENLAVVEKPDLTYLFNKILGKTSAKKEAEKEGETKK